MRKILAAVAVLLLGLTACGTSAADRAAQSAASAAAASSNLVDCDPESIFSSALRAASVRLSCDPSLGHAYLVPFRDNKAGTKKAQLIIGYKGLYQLALRSRQYELINVSTIYEGQEVVEDCLTGEVRVLGRARIRSAATRIGQLAFFRMVDGYSKALYMTKEEIHDHARRYIEDRKSVV